VNGDDRILAPDGVARQGLFSAQISSPDSPYQPIQTLPRMSSAAQDGGLEPGFPFDSPTHLTSARVAISGRLASARAALLARRSL